MEAPSEDTSVHTVLGAAGAAGVLLRTAPSNPQHSPAWLEECWAGLSGGLETTRSPEAQHG